MKHRIILVCVILAVMSLAIGAPAQTFTVLETLNPNANATGSEPVSPLVQGPDSTLYGTASSGGANASGVVFKVQPDGTGFTVIKNFSATDPNTGTNSDGANPWAGLVLSGNTLYGTTVGGGSSSNGAVFSLNTDGSDFTNLYNFTGGKDGGSPYAGLVLAGGTLYGTASGGGISSNGTVFRINTNGGAFSALYSFSGVNDGANPQAGLLLSGRMLYGTAVNGGPWGWGTVFALNTNGSGFTNIYSFDFDHGANPYGGLVLAGSALYGTTENGGSAGWGIVFAINMGNEGITVLQNFTDGSDGGNPFGGLVLSGAMLYGTTESGGGRSPIALGGGTVFGITTNGTGFTVLNSFPAATFAYDPVIQGETNSGGGSPNTGLILSGNTLYGTTVGGGSSQAGMVFKVNTDRSNFAVIENFSSPDGVANPQAGLVVLSNTLYGTTEGAGTSGGGGMVFKVNADGSGFNLIKNFSATDPNTGTNSDGGNPSAELVPASGTLYGTTSEGGSSGFGTIFAVNTNGSGFTNLYSFSGGDDGANPSAGLVLSGNTLYGTAPKGGRSSDGTVFSINVNGSNFSILHSFRGSDGSSPSAGLVLSGSTLYGTTVEGGTNYSGTVFEVNTDGSGFTNLYIFSGVDGSAPYAGLVLSGNTLYGNTESGGANFNGTVFAVNTDGSGFTNLHSFTAAPYSYVTQVSTNSDGIHPVAQLVLSGGLLYGATGSGGLWGSGTLFRINTDGNNFITIYSFSAETLSSTGYSLNRDGANPDGALALSGGTLYGTASDGGSYGAGTVFAFGLPDFMPYANSTTNGLIPLAVQFTAPSVDNNGHPITTWNWNFGDGLSSTSQNPLHTYTNTGTFSPSLVATNNIGVGVPGIGPSITAESLIANNDFEAGSFVGWTTNGDFTYASVGTGPLYLNPT
jgi:uncharacterized repeat protein (TIGR03803 family)